MRHSQSGLSLLELMVALAVVAVSLAFGRPHYEDWLMRRSLSNNYTDLNREFMNARFEAMRQNVTSRIVVADDGEGLYTITTYASNAAVTDCTSAGTWTELSSHRVEVNSRFTLDGDIDDNLCFYRDGSSSGASFTLTQSDGEDNFGSATIDVILATGALDSELTMGH
ncbi:MAG: hypothetical protein K0R63_1633 [Rickettsiales bacterium]|jgi:prepilin-type N-terminal cleavage/methylation domain-containing protein|nr:hypothetical protein [Rickettsiales bacterium]